MSVPRCAKRLCSDVILKCCVGETFDKSVAERAQRDAKRLDGFSGRDVFDDVGIRRASMNQLPAGCIDELRRS